MVLGEPYPCIMNTRKCSILDNIINKWERKGGGAGREEKEDLLGDLQRR